MTKRILSLLFALAIIFSLAACGGAAAQTEAQTQEQTAAEPEAAAENVPAAETLSVTAAETAAFESASDDKISAGGKFYSDFDSYAELLEHVGEVNTQTAEEGQVLLKNDGSLPLSGGEKVSVFGIASSTTVAGPSNNSAYRTYTDFDVSARGPIYDGLTAAGFDVNPTLADYYAALGFNQNDCGKETLDFTAEAADSVQSYNEVGVVVLARYGGEGSDLDMITTEVNDGMYGEQPSAYAHDALYRGEVESPAASGRVTMGGPMGASSVYVPAGTSENYDENGTEYKHYLQLTDAEEELIDYAAASCEKVIVVLNTSNAMEVYDLREDPRVNGILLMGRGGETGHFAVGEILTGLVSPSGKLADEWNTDFTADPTWNNFAWNAQTGSENMYYNGVYGVGMTAYNGNGNYDDYLERGDTEITYGTHNQNGYYGTDYEEDIYLGYAYWETLYHSLYEALLENETVEYRGNGVTHTVSRADAPGATVEEQAAYAAGEWWSKNVAFPFGYGLSYTTFSLNIDADAIAAYGGALQSADDTPVAGFDIFSVTAEQLSSSEGRPAAVKTLVIPVKVTNTGDTAGKEVVEIYVTAPYDSETAKLQKSFVTLAGFGKSSLLQPGESETVLVSVNVQDFASFDYADAYGQGVTGYTLEPGEYTIRAMSTSHYDYATDTADTSDEYDELRFTLADTARLVLDDFSGLVSDAIFSESYDAEEKVSGNVWAEDTDEDHYQVYNSLRTGNLMADGESAEVLLTRDTFLTYFPETPDAGDLTFSESYVKHMDYWNQFSAADIETDEWYHSADEAVFEGWAQETGVVDEATGTYAIVLSDMAGLPLFDADGTLTDEWNAFMNQLTVEEMTTLIRKNCNMWRSTGLPNIAKAANQQKDSYNNNGDTFLWVDAPTISATWNTDIAWEIGRVRGNLSLYNGWSAWGGPEMDTHRSPFSGRNYEYMSQDGLLGGYIAAQLTGGMSSMGVNTYVKHFAFNDQETCRDGMENMVWVSEQAARQIYLKVFQMCMQEGGSGSSMVGFARFCGIPTASNNHMMEGMVVNQWGWNGFFITDGYSGFSRCTTMATMMRSFVVPLPLMGRIPAISGRYDAEDGKFYAYTGAWDTEYDFYGDDFATTTVMYNDRGTVADENVKGGYRGEEIESFTQWYYMRMLAARILYAEANSITNLNGHSATKLPAFTAEERTFVNGSAAELAFTLSGEAKSCYTVDADGNKTPLYTAEYSIDGDIPEGMTFDPATGTLSGVPTKDGEYKITVSVLIDGWVSPDLVNDDHASINRFLRWTYKLLVNDDGVPTPEMSEEPAENIYSESSDSAGGSGEASGETSGDASGEAS